MNNLKRIKLQHKQIMNSFQTNSFLESNKEMNPNVYFEPFSVYDKNEKSVTVSSLSVY